MKSQEKGLISTAMRKQEQAYRVKERGTIGLCGHRKKIGWSTLLQYEESCYIGS